MRTIQVVNQSTVVPEVEFQECLEACHFQLLQHFTPAWGGLAAYLDGFSADPATPIAPADETIYILDNANIADALGYHTLTQSDVPVGFAFAETSAQYNSPWQVTFSHELLEQIADPFVATTVLAPFFGRPAALAYEVCDPCEADSYLIDGVPVSNFVLPSWFQPAAGVARGQFDHMGRISSPLAMSRNGYIAFTRNLKTWQQQLGSHVPAHRPTPTPFTRQHRRLANASRTR